MRASRWLNALFLEFLQNEGIDTVADPRGISHIGGRLILQSLGGPMIRSSFLGLQGASRHSRHR